MHFEENSPDENLVCAWLAHMQWKRKSRRDRVGLLCGLQQRGRDSCFPCRGGFQRMSPQGHILSCISGANTFCHRRVRRQGGKPRQGKEVRGEGAGLQRASCRARPHCLSSGNLQCRLQGSLHFSPIMSRCLQSVHQGAAMVCPLKSDAPTASPRPPLLSGGCHEQLACPRQDLVPQISVCKQRRQHNNTIPPAMSPNFYDEEVHRLTPNTSFLVPEHVVLPSQQLSIERAQVPCLHPSLKKNDIECISAFLALVQGHAHRTGSTQT